MDLHKDFSKVVAVIPSLHPDEKLFPTVKGLLDAGFARVVLVDDGSGPDYAQTFGECAALPGVTLISYEVNKGKGAAMKTAFAHILENMPDCAGAITVDGDGQHLPEDCRACADRMLRDDKVVLGVRDFSLPDVPKRSKSGNRLTSLVFRVFCGMKISDTQTGLRAFPADILPTLLKTKGDRYEFETQMLLDFKTYRIPFEEQTIKTVYIDENQTSHFRVVKDSFRIYKMILGHFFKYSANSIVSYMIDWGIMTLVLFLLTEKTGMDKLASNAIAFTSGWVISSLLNFFINHFVVFKAKCALGKSFFKYYALALPLAAVSLTITLLGVKGISLWDWLPGKLATYAQLYVHPVVKLILFIVTYSIQREWVYKTDKKHRIERHPQNKDDQTKTEG